MVDENIVAIKPGIYGEEVSVIPRGDNKASIKVSCQDGAGEFLASQEELTDIVSSLLTTNCSNKKLAAVIAREVSILQRWKIYSMKNPEVDIDTIIKGLNSELRIN